MSVKDFYEGKYEKSLPLLEKLARQGNIEVQRTLGDMYIDGKGVEVNYKQAAYWYDQAAQQGDAAAQYLLGGIYYSDSSPEQNYVKATYWWQKAAEQGHAEAQNILGRIYEVGKGVEQNTEKAVYWYQKAAEQGDDLAQSNLGYMYCHGLGIDENHAKAVYWWEKAAEQDNAQAQLWLGDMYLDGKGVGQNHAKALYWWQKAANNGDSEAQNRLDNEGALISFNAGLENIVERLRRERREREDALLAADEKEASALSQKGNPIEDGANIQSVPLCEDTEQDERKYEQNAHDDFTQEHSDSDNSVLEGLFATAVSVFTSHLDDKLSDRENTLLTMQNSARICTYCGGGNDTVSWECVKCGDRIYSSDKSTIAELCPRCLSRSGQSECVKCGKSVRRSNTAARICNKCASASRHRTCIRCGERI